MCGVCLFVWGGNFYLKGIAEKMHYLFLSLTFSTSSRNKGPRSSFMKRQKPARSERDSSFSLPSLHKGGMVKYVPGRGTVLKG